MFDISDFMPHGACFLWRADLLALHALSDLAIAISYFVIPFALWRLIRARPDLNAQGRRLIHLFIVFIVACGVTHILGMVTLWTPIYWTQGIAKAGTALVSMATAFIIWPLIPVLASLPSPDDLRQANDALSDANERLESDVRARTAELTRQQQRMEAVLKAANVRVVAQDADLHYTWVRNPALSKSTEDVQGKTDYDLMPPEVAQQTVATKQRAMAEEAPQSLELQIPLPSGEKMAAQLTVMPSYNEDGVVDGVVTTVVDLSKEKAVQQGLAELTAELSRTNHRFELALDHTPVAVFEQDADLRYTYMHNPPSGTTTEMFLGKDDATLFGPEESAPIIKAKQKVLATGEREELEVSVTLGDDRRIWTIVLEPMLNDAGQPSGIVGGAIEITEERNRQRHLATLMRELTHRSKNLLTVIQAMARQTASSAPTKEAFLEGFSARLQAMSASHDLLVNQSWRGAGLHDLLRANLAQAVDPEGPRVEIDGPVFQVDPAKAQTLGLAFHELVTNAAKYGALSGETGKVSVTWRCDGDTINLTWAESGGPEVTAPTRSGFGSRLLRHAVGPTLGGSVSLDFAPTGLVCEMTFPGGASKASVDSIA